MPGGSWREQEEEAKHVDELLKAAEEKEMDYPWDYERTLHGTSEDKDIWGGRSGKSSPDYFAESMNKKYRDVERDDECARGGYANPGRY